jgi:hypothetical protein
MKQNSIFAATLVALATTLFSCTKEKLKETSVAGTTPAPVAPAQVRIVSDWLSLSLTNATYSSASSLQGQNTLSSTVNYDYTTHVQLVYARNRGRESYVFEKLPLNFSTFQGNVKVDFTLDYNNFTLNIWNTDSPSLRPVAQQYSNMQYRFIVIPKTTYQALTIDWTDYNAVATALNL